MKHTFKKSDFLKSIFPDIDVHDDEAVRHVLTVYYTRYGQTPEIEISGDKVIISLPESVQQQYAEEFYRATDLCTARRYQEAIPIFQKLIETDPQVSEYHRNLGQAYEELGDYDKAIDSLIEALRWNPKNNWALLLMGNIYMRKDQDTQTALTYFDQILEADPKNYLALSNIAGTFLKADKTNLAERFFKRSLEVNPSFVNALHGMGIVAYRKENFLDAIDFGVRALKAIDPKDNSNIRKVIEGFLINVASESSKNDSKMEIVAEFISELEKQSGKEIRIQTEENLPVEAKIEIAENYDRDYHLVSFRPNAPRVEHLICHELTHLKLILEARCIGENQLFTSDREEFLRFWKLMEPVVIKLTKDGIPKDSVDGYINRVFHGLNSRIYNAPIDLFIEDYLYDKFQDLRAHQLVSLIDMDNLALQAVTDPQILRLTPASIISKIKVYNALTARHIDFLFGTSLESRYPLSPKEKGILDSFWTEYQEYRSDREPGEEYELVQHWAEDLELETYFKLKADPNNQTEGSSPTVVLEKIEKDPTGSKESNPEEQSQMEKFVAANSDGKVNMAVFLHMVDAIKFYKNKEEAEIQETAMELAMLGRTGIDPNKSSYKLSFIKGKNVSGYKVLAFMYVAFSLSLPDLLKELALPFDKEYDLAMKMK
jgi:tetratricopeptide (TPR) repeat protein